MSKETYLILFNRWKLTGWTATLTLIAILWGIGSAVGLGIFLTI